MQITINSILSVYKASEILDKNCKDSNQIIMVLQYLVQIKSLLENRNNENRFEEVFKKIKVWKLIPINEEQNEKYVRKILIFIKYINFRGTFTFYSKTENALEYI